MSPMMAPMDLTTLCASSKYRAVAAILALQLTGCGHLQERVTAEALIGAKLADGGFYGTGPIFTGTLAYRVSDRVVCQYTHISFVTKGPPFGPRNEEDSLDAASCGVRFGR